MAVTAKQVEFCLKHLHDGARLRQSSLTQLPSVKRLAAERYRNGYWGTAQALKDVVIETIALLDGAGVTDKKSMRMLTFLRMYADEKAIVEIARTLAVHRGTIYRFVMPEAFELLASELQRDIARQHAT
jgi:hypothetical protein